MMSQQTQELVQDIGERAKAADLIESRYLLQYCNSLKTDYVSKQPLMSQKKNYLDIAHLLPETPQYGGMRSRHVTGDSMHLAGDMYRSWKRGKDIGKLLKNELLTNEYLGSGSMKGRTYRPMNAMGAEYF